LNDVHLEVAVVVVKCGTVDAQSVIQQVEFHTGLVIIHDLRLKCGL